ncbi:hypothetical protein FOMPIDRAFT_143470 [Fomitopsis schrenkii]|uniref:Autophagy-related protein 4 n=1 Tax=Fomitopsis schrenkii TaxID=2126942 RepID=S8F1S4_FOMSC|nr:hypothetical protein FOMPIDRAFT_143470 [Fomitopsis schrenkii]
MASKQKSFSPSSSSPGATGKLPKLFHKSGRDRSKSVADPTASSSSSPVPVPALDTAKPRKSLKKVLSPTKERDEKRRTSHDTDNIDRVEAETPADEPPVIVEPVNIPRPRTRSERPVDPNNTYPQSFYPSSPSGRIADLPTRLSGWFSHTFSTSSTDLSLPSLLSQQHLGSNTTSPRGKGSALLTAARHGKGHLDKAMRYLLDSDATPDKCTDPIWLLGVEHPGYEPNPPPTASVSALSASTGNGVVRRGSADSRRSPSSLRSSTSSAPGTPYDQSPLDTSFSALQLTPTTQTPANSPKDPSKNWPPVFYADFTSRIWLTYRSQFQPIRDTTLSALESEIGETSAVTNSPQPKRWNWPIGGEKGWTSDAGWGCMLRTGQSLLANALLHLHLGRDWRRPPYPIYTADYATYVQTITWFLDTPSPLAPFSVHRMALVGKELGKDVGQWFGPSTAAGAIKTLVHAFPEAGLGVSVAADGGVIYQSDVYAVSHSVIGPPQRYARLSWGDRGVLILIGIRLGLDGVNPVYYDTIKALYTFPQSVGIAGGRPSSSYYFVGSQTDNLFYLDPHHARPAVPLRPPPRFGDTPASSIDGHLERATSPDNLYSSDRERERDRHPRKSHHFRSPTTPSSVRMSSGSGGSGLSHRSSPVAPSPLQQALSTSSSSATSQSSSSQNHARWQSSPNIPDDSDMDLPDLGADLDPIQRHYVTAYSAADLRTFHCDRVRKMPLSGLDPSMLVGFLVKDEDDWIDFRRRVAELAKTHKQIFYIHDEPPNWPSDPEDSIGLESISEPDIDMPEDDDDDFSDRARSPSASPDTSVQGVGSKSEADTEDDPIGPVTPGPGTAKSSFDIPQHDVMTKSKNTVDEPISFDDEEDEEWGDPAEYPEGEGEPAPSVVRSEQQIQAPPMAPSLSTSSTMSTGTTGSKKRKKTTKKGSSSREKQVPVPVPMPPPVQFPFPATSPDDEGSPREPEDYEARERQTTETGNKRVPQMRTAKARDGGRTQSGGVRGVPADDFDDFS